MSWSQVKGFSVAARRRQLEDRVALWRITHDRHVPKQYQGELVREFKRERAELDRLSGRKVRMGGIKLGDLAAAMGGVVKKYKLPDGSFIDAAEWEKRKRGDSK